MIRAAAVTLTKTTTTYAAANAPDVDLAAPCRYIQVGLAATATGVLLVSGDGATDWMAVAPGTVARMARAETQKLWFKFASASTVDGLVAVTAEA